MTSSRKLPVLAFVLLLGANVGAADFASAADVPMPVKATAPVQVLSPWSYRFTPYFWAPSLNGSSALRGHTADVDVTFIDLLHRKIPKELFGLMAAFEARNDRFSIFADFVYVMVGASKSGSRSIVLGPLLSASVAGSIDVKVEMAIAELAAAYEIARWGGGMPGSGTAIDVFGGGRLWWQKAEADLAVTAGVALAGFTFSGGRAFAGSGDITWADPIVGMRLRHQFAPGHEFVLSGDVGGFGVGSEFSWQVVGAFRWDFAKTSNVTWSGMIGYRALSVDYSEGAGVTRYEYDMLQHGPIFGLSMRF
jgi:hypothetical protein